MARFLDTLHTEREMDGNVSSSGVSTAAIPVLSRLMAAAIMVSAKKARPSRHSFSAEIHIVPMFGFSFTLFIIHHKQQSQSVVGVNHRDTGSVQV